jgi:DNA ligase 1
MLKPWQVIAELENENSRLFKESVIRREAEAGNGEFFRGARAALDSMITFGVKKVAEKSGPGRGIRPETFWQTAKDLSERRLTGNDAQNAVNYLRMNATEEEWNLWYRRILIKDLRCGVSEKTINSTVESINGDYVIPVFSCQLAHDGANHESKVSGPKLVEVKLDGVRVITIVYPSGNVDQYSRNGKELVNFDHIKRQFAKHARFLKEPMVFDGEVMSSSFQDLMRQVHRKSDVEASDAVLHLFDILTLADFQRGRSAIPQTERSAALKVWYNPIADHVPNIKILGHEFVDLDTPTGQDQFQAINQRAIAGGYEGIMIKDPAAPYECKRTTAWLKQNPTLKSV